MCPIFVGSVYNFGRSNDDTSDKIISDKMLISHRCISGLMPNLMKKSWTVSTTNLPYIIKVGEKSKNGK